jgi:hypothetical protein
MAVRESNYDPGTALHLVGKVFDGKIYLNPDGFDFDRAVGQQELPELLPAQCSNIDARYANMFKVSLTSDIPNFNINYKKIGTYIFIFSQDSSGGKTVTFGEDFYWISGIGAPNFSSDASGTINIITFLCDGSKFYGTYMQNFVNS